MCEILICYDHRYYTRKRSQGCKLASFDRNLEHFVENTMTKVIEF